MLDMKPSPAAAVINSPQASAGGRKAPAGGQANVTGSMGKADMAGAMDGRPSDGLMSAVSRLKSLG